MFCGVSGGQMPLPFAMGIHHTLVPKPDNMVPRGVCAKQLRALEESHMMVTNLRGMRRGGCPVLGAEAPNIEGGRAERIIK